jgi:3-deoxy-D-manno-octulosonate 8-phosphate phosphatase (KDO 8-P phosphatase)
MISQAKIDDITTIILDVDGVLTDGRVGYGDEDEIKFFNIRDGHGIKLAMRAGLQVGLLSGRSAAANRRRAEELGMSFVYENCKNKLQAFEKLLHEHALRPEQCLYIGDDIVDAPVMRRCGIGVTVADAPEYMNEFCDIRTVLPGGRGAVREITDWLLQSQNKWDALMERYRA